VSSGSAQFPDHLPREEEHLILKAAEEVRATRKTRALLLYGPGGIGKTSMVRALASTRGADGSTVWIDPIDVDDTEFWLLSNLERRVVEKLDPERHYFGPYSKYVSRLPTHEQAGIDYNTIVSRLGRLKEKFIECYNNMVEDSNKSVIITFDTVEAIRDTSLLLTLTQWMKALDATLFILSGRPVRDDIEDPILTELNDPHQPIPVDQVRLGAFAEATADSYLDKSSAGPGLTDQERSKLVLLTRGHPLWLAFTISYLHEKGIPEEVGHDLGYIRRNMPFERPMTQAGQQLYDAFRRRLVAPYRESDFWHEADKRLAVVREGVNQEIWEQLVLDLPHEKVQADGKSTWEQLLERPWIRPRANKSYVTLHDAVAEELAQRIIPLHDQDQQWRRELWRRMAKTHDQLIAIPEREFPQQRDAFNARAELLSAGNAEGGRVGRGESPADMELIEEAADLDVRRRNLDRLKAGRFYYSLLSDFTQGANQFLELFEKAKQEHDVLFRDLLGLELQLFLPGKTEPYAFNDLIREVAREFHGWLPENAQTYIRIGIEMAGYLIEKEQPNLADELIRRLPTDERDLDQDFRLNILQGNACMRIPDRVRSAIDYFSKAQNLAGRFDEASGERQRRTAQAYKEIGFYNRNRGLRDEADEAYKEARIAISKALAIRDDPQGRLELASVKTNWAYVKGLKGLFQEGVNLVESAIAVRRGLGQRQEEGASLSVAGEIYRFERRFQKAWESYKDAEEIFKDGENWYWLGLIYQEQATCLFQAMDDHIMLSGNPLGDAERLIIQSLGICRHAAVRGYPSALNRAGRIYGYGMQDFDVGLDFLEKSIEEARRLADGWFLYAGLVEYAELSYRAWTQTRRGDYREQITARTDDIDRAEEDYSFPDLGGRWKVVHGHLALHDWEASGDTSYLGVALRNYKEGFEGIAKQGHAGSSGPSKIPEIFKIFGDLFRRLPADVRKEWYEELNSAWLDKDEASTLLLTRLEELY